MNLVKAISVVFVICATLAQDLQEENQEEGREIRNYNQDWRSVDYLSPFHETSGWIPHPQMETDEQPLKRRRIRKRKRRPPVFTPTEEEEPRRNTRPHRLEQLKEPWEEMSDEIIEKSNSRRRLTPVYNEAESEEAKVPIYEKIRDPFTALQEAEEKQRKKVEETARTPDLRTILKQSGGLSLSEVLQQKNLTLSELLNGNRQAISVLAREAETTTETSTEGVKYRRIPPSIAMKKDRNFTRESKERLTSHEVMEAQRKRLALLHSHKDTKMFPDVVKFDVVTEATTENRIFVPSSPKYISLDYRITESDIATILTTTTTTTQATVSSKSRKLPMTSAKLNKLAPQAVPDEVSKVPNKAVSINLNEILGLNIFKRNETELPDEPLKMIIDLESVTTQTSEKIPVTTSSPLKILEELTMTTTSVAEKLKHVTAKDEIMEILKDPLEREHLSRILRLRNMTVEELVAQRERGSSQLHLADIFHNKTREPEPQDEPFIGRIEHDGGFPGFNRKAKAIPTVSDAASTTQPSLKAEQKMTTKLPYTITSFPTYKIETSKDAKPFLPIWEQLYPHFFSDVLENTQENPGIVRAVVASTEKIDFDEVERLEEIENSLAEAANGHLKVDLPQHVYDDDEEEFINLPTGVKSAILASLAIIGLSLLVFLTILLIFKWTQKQKSRLNYNESFSGCKIRSPILENNQKRTFRNFVSETLGRKKNYYKAHVQSMSDSIWDSEEKKSYMI